MLTEIVYKRDSKGKIRSWQAETEGNKWRTIAGIQDGKMVTSEWRLSLPKNVGKANETTAEQQAILEAEAAYKKKTESGYYLDINAIDTFEQFKPMLANDYAKLKKPLEFPVWSQPKLDGIRCVAKADGLWTRAGKPHLAIPHIWEAVKPLFDEHPDLVLDGELYNHSLRDDFNEITSIVRKAKPTAEDIEKSAQHIQFHIYDMVYLDNPDMDFMTRNLEIQRLLDVDNTSNKSLKWVFTRLVEDEEDLDNRYQSYLERGYEGQMVRLDGSLYENKRSKNLLKRKEFITAEFKVLAVEEGQGNWSGCVKRFHLELPNGGTTDAGVRGTQKELRKLFESGKTPDWCTLRYFTPTPDGIPRFPVVIDYGFGKRED